MLDAEGKVIGHLPGRCKNKGVLGALQCKLPNGKQFKIGTGLSDADRKKPPKIGDLVSYCYQELTPKGIPRFPAFRGIVIDR